jgi:hypothetical protein
MRSAQSIMTDGKWQRADGKGQMAVPDSVRDRRLDTPYPLAPCALKGKFK